MLREHFVPLHSSDVVDYLCQHPALPADQESDFRRVSTSILALFHHQYRRRHEQLSTQYAWLDPDRDRLLRTVPTPEGQVQIADDLLDHTRDMLLRANYHRLTSQHIQAALRAASRWGVRMRVDFEMLERLEVYARGFGVGERDYRDWRQFFRRQIAEVPLYQRLVVIFQVTSDSNNSQFDPRFVYMRMFKNVPQLDVDMMLPATGVHMSWLDHSKIVVPSLYAMAITLWRFLRNVVLLAFFGVFKTIGMIVLVLFAIGFGVKSMFTYRSQTKRRYMLNMAQSLYYQNLDNNAGVLLRLLDEGEQQEACEAILAYFVVATQSSDRQTLTSADIDERCERLIHEVTGLDVDFDVENAVGSLSELGIAQRTNQGWTALAPDTAIRCLDQTWDDRFSY